ncbi:TM2 domain-containing protein [Lutibacter holmesii]|uniref:TM2 domain-containing protein n=2 Tax=Lutibacter holmesii TaxID=1137985 RepID=A0ABW3WL95_9FLAO
MRKSFIFSMVALSFLLFSTNAFASFPVKKSTNTETSVVMDADTNADSADIAVVGSGKSQLTALLLVIFLGWLGVHRFYLGYIWQGVVQLLTLGGFGIWALIDLIRIITGDLQPKNGPYSKTL